MQRVCKMPFLCIKKFDWGSKGREFESHCSDHSFTIRHLGLYPSAFLFAILRVIFEVKTPQCLYCRRFRVNPDAPKSHILRFIHSVFQSPGTLSTALLPATLDIAIYRYSAAFALSQSIPNRLHVLCKIFSAPYADSLSCLSQRSFTSQKFKLSQPTCQKLIWNWDFTAC